MYDLEIYCGTIYHDNEKDAKLEEELTCRFKIEMRTLMGSIYSKQKMYELKIDRGVLCHVNEE